MGTNDGSCHSDSTVTTPSTPCRTRSPPYAGLHCVVALAVVIVLHRTPSARNSLMSQYPFSKFCCLSAAAVILGTGCCLPRRPPCASSCTSDLKISIRSDYRVHHAQTTATYLRPRCSRHPWQGSAADAGQIRRHRRRSHVYLTLRDGLLWHDGTPVTAEDGNRSIKRWGAKDAMGRR